MCPTVSITSNSTNSTDNYKFTGHEGDTEASLTLDYMMARNYDPVIGRFLQIDPITDQFPGWTPYHYVHNNPLNLVDPTGMSAEKAEEAENCPPCSIEYFIRWLFQDYDNTYIGDLFRADAQGDGKLEQKVAQDAKAVGNAIVDATAEIADDVSDASTILAASGIVAAPFTGGSSLTVTGYALGVGTAADLTSAGAKTIDAVAFDGSSEVAFDQFVETTVNFGAGKLANKVAGSFVRVGSTGRFVTNQFGQTVTAVRDATRVMVPVALPPIIKKTIGN